jgi:hypothetical protein
VRTFLETDDGHNDAVIPIKASLPYPYDQDFSDIVVRIKGKRATTRASLANSMKVASYLKAGASLVERNLDGRDPTAGSADGARKPYWSGIRFLTERALIHEVEMIPPPFLRQKGDGPYRATWASHDDYINDLLAFLFHPINYDPQYGAAVQTRADWLVSEGRFVDAFDHASYYELQAICRMPLFRLQLMMAATAHRNDGIHEAIAENYAGALEPWKKIYEATFAARAFRMRRGVTLDQLTDMLAAVVEGFAVRHLGDPNAGIIGSTPEGNLVGMAVIAIVSSYVEPANNPSGLSLREEFEARAASLRGRNRIQPEQGS